MCWLKGGYHCLWEQWWLFFSCVLSWVAQRILLLNNPKKRLTMLQNWQILASIPPKIMVETAIRESRIWTVSDDERWEGWVMSKAKPPSQFATLVRTINQMLLCSSMSRGFTRSSSLLSCWGRVSSSVYFELYIVAEVSGLRSTKSNTNHH